MDIGRVFSTSFAMFRQRFWLLLGMWLVFLVIQFAAAIAIFVGVIGMGLAGAAGLAGGLEDPAAFTGLGIGMIAAIVVFYAGYIVILLAQQAAMVTIASPLEEPSFGGAMVRGFRSALPFFALWCVKRLGRLRQTPPAPAALALFAWLLTLHPTAAGRVYAAYGGVYVAMAIIWLWLVDGIRPSQWDLLGAAVALLGMAIIMFAPRSA